MLKFILGKLECVVSDSDGMREMLKQSKFKSSECFTGFSGRNGDKHIFIEYMDQAHGDDPAVHGAFMVILYDKEKYRFDPLVLYLSEGELLSLFGERFDIDRFFSSGEKETSKTL